MQMKNRIRVNTGHFRDVSVVMIVEGHRDKVCDARL